MKPRFQFTIKRGFLATFWMAVCFASWAFVARARREQWDHSPPARGEITLLFLMFGSPIVAVAALLGRALIAAIVMLALAIVFHAVVFP